jgi:ATP-dependent DNA ligase
MTLPPNKKYAPMEAEPARDLPSGPEWQYEPKWDGFRCIAFRDGGRVDLQSKSSKPLRRYFPELAAALLAVRPKQFVLDGEIVIPVDGHLSFDELLMRIHPAASRVLKLSQEHPCVFVVFDLLVDEKGKSLVKLPLEKRREKLERLAKSYFEENPAISLSPVTDNLSQARK